MRHSFSFHPGTAVLIAAILFFSGVVPLFAAEPSIEASLSSSTAEVGEPLQFELEITGANPGSPPAITVDGLDIQLHGNSTQISMINGTVTRKVS